MADQDPSDQPEQTEAAAPPQTGTSHGAGATSVPDAGDGATTSGTTTTAQGSTAPGRVGAPPIDDDEVDGPIHGTETSASGSGSVGDV
jgi:hypothetical protein